jgi:hypothetical protein
MQKGRPIKFYPAPEKFANMLFTPHDFLDRLEDRFQRVTENLRPQFVDEPKRLLEKIPAVPNLSLSGEDATESVNNMVDRVNLYAKGKLYGHITT